MEVLTRSKAPILLRLVSDTAALRFRRSATVLKASRSNAVSPAIQVFPEMFCERRYIGSLEFDDNYFHDSEAQSPGTENLSVIFSSLRKLRPLYCTSMRFSVSFTCT